ncbi:GSCFA domain-containing protein [Pleomorphovibrio marinus]|uniref:GSCFA domain-containing protein n=1 Tax=Pleomorphovibrio marinus TaxID=2164132 RepID=UPI000E0AE2A8|nr:GSCFA domain-containing protein [Pleomorphovibrio marinus]
MKLRTTFEFPAFPKPLNYRLPIISMGSCFADMIGARLERGKFKVTCNPFGIIYNPISLLHLIYLTIKEEGLDPSALLKREDHILHYHLHSGIFGVEEEPFLRHTKHIQADVLASLRNAGHFFLTWGTAYAYERKADGSLVANCHKQPTKLFTKRLLTLEEMHQKFREVYPQLKAISPGMQIILTLSPVRHIKDGLPQNQVSKSLLRVFCHELEEKYEDVSYFPAYEWLLDDLRDYRFYAEDLIHPSKLAEDYIWEKFIQVFMEKSVIETYEAILKIHQSLAHKPFFPQGAAHQKFLKKLLQEMEQFSGEFDFAKEISQVKAQLHTN